MEIREAMNIVRKHFTKGDVEISPDVIIEGIRGEVVSEAFIVYCKEKGYVKG